MRARLEEILYEMNRKVMVTRVRKFMVMASSSWMMSLRVMRWKMGGIEDEVCQEGMRGRGGGVDFENTKNHSL